MYWSNLNRDNVDPKNVEDVKEFINSYKTAKPVKSSELFILGYLSIQDMSGYDIYKLIKKAADTGGSAYRLNKTTTYNTLARMDRDGLIELSKTIRTSKKPIKEIYSITDEGLEYLHEIVYTDLNNPPLVYINFLPALTFSKILTKDELKTAISLKIEQLGFILGFLKISSQISPGTISEIILESKIGMYNSLLKSLKKMLKIIEERSIDEFMQIKKFDSKSVEQKYKTISDKEV